ncbi:cysteine peptidase family C39 domain-containing protein [Algoriphagus winogradskyi]|uniref:Peptidase C39 family protein n=1 Tax=Algoriphagus winogradskyi TaxID=237017 RepID=A0ABY1P0K8_9BACT|nr:cysteine peptidase family C39 domain-containing protein [Algoriphagus winogradskyi]SMP23498.1 Peptidase C39 family protein [Algoriphagus winogradskyi]
MEIRNIEQYFVRQQSSSDCGVACLASVIKFFGGHSSLEQLREFSGTAIGGTTMLGLSEAAARIGMTSDAFRVDGIERLKELETPAIMHVVIGGKLSHYIVCFSWENEKITCIDPSKGVVIYTPKELSEVWLSKALLLCTPGESFIIQKLQEKGKREWLLSLVKEDMPILLISGFLGLLMTLFGLSVGIFSQKLIIEILPEKHWEKLILGLGLVTVLLAARSVVAFLKSTELIQQSKDLNIAIFS